MTNSTTNAYQPIAPQHLPAYEAGFAAQADQVQALADALRPVLARGHSSSASAARRVLALDRAVVRAADAAVRDLAGALLAWRFTAFGPGSPPVVRVRRRSSVKWARCRKNWANSGTGGSSA